MQSQINKGFLAWMFKEPERLLSSLNADNETLSTLFFQFLSQNPKYQELFKQYDKLLSEEIQVDMLRQANETFKHIDLIISEGEIVREWNTTSTVNDTTYTYVYRDYALEINGTTQHLLKVSVYASDGTLITDPYIKIINAPLMYWTWWWGWYPVLYGWDYGIYQHYTAGLETVLFLAADEYLEDSTDWADVTTIIGVIVSIAGFAGFPAGLLATITGAVLAVVGLSAKEIARKVWERISLVNMFNAHDDPSFGFMLYQNFHWVANPQWFDPLSYTRFCAIQSNGVVIALVPLSLDNVCYMSAEQVSVYVSFLTWYNTHVGFGNWVWVSPA
ncbi:MAG: hypothetical protein KIH08_17145 [Candidatus Freyarchaeota archaeon]|nr:hypothetical protein [Candidatus Jordarchaeia archaeon]MBS7268058.1 hypothetical protein [Candidatus Jordarchaeia archaeon]MBS7278933.1 hypothetical protein [Candidatus Jordarchaeia archaeon]